MIKKSRNKRPARYNQEVPHKKTRKEKKEEKKNNEEPKNEE